jgi:hypothetical protein
MRDYASKRHGSNQNTGGKMVHEPPFESVSPTGPMIGYATPEAPARPTSAFVISIIGIVYASLGLLSGVFGVVSVVVILVIMRQQQGGAMFGGFKPGWNIAFALGGLVLAALLLFASIAAMRMREVGRAWMIRWAWAYIVWQVFTLAVQALVIMPAALAAAGAGGAGGVGPMALPATARMFMYAGPILSLIVTLVFPVFVLAIMSRANVRYAYDRAIEQGLTGGRVTFAGETQPMTPPGQYPAS